MATKKKTNPIVSYFKPFGLRQICDITLAVAAITIILGLSLFSVTVVILPIGLFLMILGGLIAAFRSAKIMLSGINRRSPEFKQALVNTIIMGLLSVVAIISVFIFFFVQMKGV